MINIYILKYTLYSMINKNKLNLTVVLYAFIRQKKKQ